jgi:hypothetical protein|tara:strand:+ start:614 stop:1282 length:669 start_codon:yes stop_codon:yes gene_type:complete
MKKLKQRIKNSDKLFYGEYQYCLRCSLPHANSIGKDFDPKHITHIMDLRKNLYKRSNSSAKKYPNHATVKQLLKANEFFKSIGRSSKFVFTGHMAYVYTNNYHLRDDLDNLGIGLDQCTTINVNRPKNTVYSQYPGFNKRCLLKEINITNEEKSNFLKFLEGNEQNIRTSRGLARFLKHRSNYHWLRGYFFVDFNDEKLISIMELMIPGIIKKTIRIINKTN